MATADTLAAPVKDILNFEGLSTEDFSAATGSTFNAQGASLEAGAYTTAEQVAQQNEELAAVSGDITNTQTQRDVRTTIGAQRAAVASAGFGDSGSALALARSSRQQGYLQEQLTGVEAQIQEGGYAGQAVASKMEADAANVASTAATTLAAEQQKQGALMQSYAVAEANAVDALTAPAGTGGAKFNGINWVQPTPTDTVATNLANSVASGQPLSPPQLTNAAVTQGGGQPAARFNGVSWSR